MAAALAGLAGLALAGTEVGVWLRGESARWALYAGGAGALLAAVCGVPFAIKLAALRDSNDDARFWRVWGTGLATRTGVAGIAALVLWNFTKHPDVAVILLALVHFAALMIETVWAASRLKTDVRK